MRFHFTIATTPGWVAMIALMTLGLAVGCTNSDFAGNSGKKTEAKTKQVKADDDDSSDDEQDDAKGGDATKNDDDLDQDKDDVLRDENLDCDKGKAGLVGKLYQLPEGTDKLPNFKTLTALGQVEASQLDVAERDWTQGFPGVPLLDEWFAIEFFASLKVPADGQYKFRTHSDDGSKLYIDGSLVVDNDGKHAPTSKEGSKELSQGKHKIKVEWFQGPRTKIALQVYWTPPSGSEEIIPTSALTRNKDCDLKDLGDFE